MLNMRLPEKIMLVRFSVSNFKNFGEKIVLDLRSRGDYDFNETAVDDGVVTKAMVYGANGSGKTNLALALFDIVLNLTNNACAYDRYEPYLNMDSDAPYAEFEYAFDFEGVEIVYSYAKKSLREFVSERLTVGGREVLWYDFEAKDGKVLLRGAEMMNLSLELNPISRVKYVMNNCSLPNTLENRAFMALNVFVDRMLMFDWLGDDGYQGMQSGKVDCIKGIVRKGEAKGFEGFLRNSGIDYRFETMKVNGEDDLFCRYGGDVVPFRTIASTGTMSLAAFYYWYLSLDRAALVYIDEFDAFYHHGLAANIVELLKGFTGAQVILSTHNTDLLSNDLLRPDCYYVIIENRIDCLHDLTDKDIRKEHNIQKMYKAGSFDGRR